MNLFFCLLFSVIASEWNPNEGMLADQVLQADGQGEWVTARRLAQELLDEQPNSYVGHHVLGRAFWLGEGDYARASFHLRKSLEIYASNYDRTAEPPWRLESEGWWSLRIVTGDMGDFEEELNLIDVYNQKQVGYQERFGTAYNSLMAERGWPLMKLGRFSEARYWGQQGIASESNWQTSLGWNVLCATAGEEGLRQELP
jgi:tetratricopeptide (TPR) repeat protein